MLLHLPEPARVDVFGPTRQYGTTVDWRAWVKPRGYTMLSIRAVSGGGGGGGGRGGGAGTGKGGGGGGASSPIVCVTIPLYLLPDVIYYSVGAGGPGGDGGSSAGANGTSGSVGDVTYVSVATIGAASSAANLLIQCGSTQPGAGGTTTTAAGGTATSAPAQTTMIASYCAFFRSVAGIAGTAAGSGAGNNAGSSFTQTTGSQILPGCGGAGSSTGGATGGGINALSDTPFTASAGGTPGNRGKPGFRWGQFPKWYGGTGGGSSNIIPGGDGGHGCAPGVGGGGGGGGVGGGRGGDGGPGQLIFALW